MSNGDTPVMGKIYTVGAAAGPVGIYPNLWLALYNSGYNTVYVNLEGGIATVGGDRTHEIPPGETLPTPPLGRSRISAICVRAGGRLTVFGADTQITTLAKRQQQTGRIIRGYDVTAINDGDTIVYNIATDLIAAVGGHRVMAVLLICEDNPCYVRFDASTAAVTEPEAFVMEVGDILVDSQLELIDAIHARNVGAGNNFTLRGKVIGD